MQVCTFAIYNTTSGYNDERFLESIVI